MKTIELSFDEAQTLLILVLQGQDQLERVGDENPVKKRLITLEGKIRTVYPNA